MVRLSEEEKWAKMECEFNRPQPHILAFPLPKQGHINPLLQFCKRLASRRVRVTLLLPSCAAPSLHVLPTSRSVQIAAISAAAVANVTSDAFRTAVADGLADFLAGSDPKPALLVYDSLMPWLLPVAKRFGLHGAPFFTQSSAVNQIFDLIHRGALEVPVEDGARISLPSLAVDLDAADLPISFPLGGIAVVKLFKASQFVNLQEVKWMFCNTFHKLEPTVGGERRMRSIGPSVPSAYLDKRLEDDQSYGISLFSSDTSDDTVEWLNSKAATSVVYVSFGSVVSLEENQVREIASSLRDNNNPFVWVLGESESQKLPTNFLSETSEKGLVLSWCCQLQVLAHSAIGCFVTHCGWNSTLEALSTGVPMVAVPKWSDQTTNAKFISDVWGVGVRAKVNEEGIFTRMEISKCIKELMEGERGKGIRRNSLKWKELAREAMDEGGTSDSNIDDFVKELINST